MSVLTLKRIHTIEDIYNSIRTYRRIGPKPAFVEESSQNHFDIRELFSQSCKCRVNPAVALWPITWTCSWLITHLALWIQADKSLFSLLYNQTHKKILPLFLLIHWTEDFTGKSKNPRHILNVPFFSLIAACKFICLTKGYDTGVRGGEERESIGNLVS